MTENSNPFLEPEIPLNTVDAMEGLDDLSGPAAFKAKQKAEQIEEANSALIDLTAKLSSMETSLAQSNDQLLRSVAEMDNLRKRSIREREDASKYAVTSFAKDLLDVADTFARALQAIPPELRDDPKVSILVQGIEATEKSFLSCFSKNGIRKIDPLDEPFNPHFHEVMFESPVAGKATGTIIQVIESGYVINDRLLRPARVGVAKASPADGQIHTIDTNA